MADVVRSTVRLRLSRLLGDLVTGTATSGSTTTLVDTNELTAYSDDKLIGYHVYIYGGTGIGKERYITDSVQSTGTITVATWTQPSTDSTYEIHRTWRVGHYNDAINQAINDIRGDGGALVTKAVDVSLSLLSNGTSTSYYYTLPTGFKFVKELIMESATTSIYDEPIPMDAWTLDKTTAATSSADAVATLVFDRNRWEPISGRKVRILGGGVQAELTDDTTALLSEHLLSYVVNKAAYWLLQSAMGLGTPDAQANARRAQIFLAGAEDARSHFDHKVPPGSKRVPW